MKIVFVIHADIKIIVLKMDVIMVNGVTKIQGASWEIVMNVMIISVPNIIPCTMTKEFRAAWSINM